MELRGKKVLVCDCEGTMRLDGGALARACGQAGARSATVHRQLCRAELAQLQAAAREGRPLVVACTQEAPLFDEVLADLESSGRPPAAGVAYTNVRERAGWSGEGDRAGPKIAALLAEAALDLPPTPTVTMRSEGACLVYGRDEAAIEAAKRLAPRLDVTVLLTRPGDDIPPPRVRDVPVARGTIAAARGHLGAFELTVEGYALPLPSSRAALRFEEPSHPNTVTWRCDFILDLSGGAPLFPAHARRDGYLRPDPGHPAAVERALFDLVDLVGEFEKPRYVDFHAALCAHSRSGRTGCTRCLEVCPAAAIRPDGDTVAIDPFLCGGCGACHSVCPTGAAAYALPPVTALLERLRTLLGAYAAAGGRRPVLLVHDPRHGDEMIEMMARHGRGLPAAVLPFAVNEVTQVGLDALAAAFAYGAAQVVILAPPRRRDELAGLEGQIAVAEAVLSGLGYADGGGGSEQRVRLAVEDDPDALEALLYGLPAPAPVAEPATFLPMGSKRTLTRMALDHLHAVAPAPRDVVPLPAGAPFGLVRVDVEGCTLCLACVGACPTGALQDNPDLPQLRFQEDACVQCGLCANTCPERVITLEPRLSFTDEARRALVVKEEEPFACIRCGKPFGTKSTIERIVAKLADRHAMFKSQAAIDRIRMCDDCRVIHQFETGKDPLAAGERPKPRTTADYLRERAEIEEARARVRAERGDG